MDEVKQWKELLVLMEVLDKEIRELRETELPALAQLNLTEEAAFVTRTKRICDLLHKIEDLRYAEKDAGLCEAPTASEIANGLFYLRGNRKEMSVGHMRLNSEEGAQVLERLLRHEGYDPGRTAEWVLNLHVALLERKNVTRSFSGGFTAEERARGYHIGRCEICRKRFRKDW